MKKKKNLAAKIVSAFAYLLIAAVILMLVFVIYSGINGNAAFIGGYAVMWVQTPSMEPLIPARSYILVKECEAKDVKLDDVIVFRSDDPALAGAYNTHRVIGISDDGMEYTTKGDNNSFADQYTAKADKIAGVYRKTLSTLSVFGRFLSTPIGMTAAGAIVLGLMLAVYLPEMKRAEKAKEQEIEKEYNDEIRSRIQAEVERLKEQNAAQPEPDPASPSPPDDPGAEAELTEKTKPDPSETTEETGSEPGLEEPTGALDDENTPLSDEPCANETEPPEKPEGTEE